MPEDHVREVPVAYTRRIPLVQHVCPVCMATFDGPRIRTYCSEKCRKAAAWQRHGAKYNANRKLKGKEDQEN